jgi:hypothetical protein
MAPQSEERTVIVTEVAKWPIDGMDSGRDRRRDGHCFRLEPKTTVKLL